MPIDYYIYYRLKPDQHETFVGALSAMQAAMHARTGIQGRFRRRLDDPLTWMEIYEGVRDRRQFETELGLLVEHHGLIRFMEGDAIRHMERFRALPDESTPCA